MLALPSKRWVFLGTAAVLGSGAALRKIQKSEPIQRALYFWKHAGPIIAHYKFTKWWLNVQKVHGVQRGMIFEELHDRYAQPALDIALHLTGLYVKLGQYNPLYESKCQQATSIGVCIELGSTVEIDGLVACGDVSSTG